jgi:membrane protein DedA with SNARE-associated domain/membrane-associated phospholipid phosphatase
MLDGVSPILQWLNANPHLAGLATFLISAAESIAIIGTIVPGSVMMTGIGALAGAGVMPLYSTVMWAILGAIAGDSVSYWLGRYFNNRLRYIWPFRQHPELLLSGERFFHKYGGMSVFIGRFVGPVRALVPMVAGMLGVKPLRFTIANVASAIGWAPVYMLPGILLGAAALELPSDITMHFILTLFLGVLFIILCIWVIKVLFTLISGQINQMLTRIWSRLQKVRYFYPITTALRHHNHTKTHGQLTLALSFLLITAAFLYLAMLITVKNSSNFAINNFCFFLFRSLRSSTSDTVMLWITLLGEQKVLAPLIVTMFAWFAWSKRWHTAWHVLTLGLLTIVGLDIFKWFVHSQRPWGIIGNSSNGFSFPSGHTGLATAFYLGLTLLLVKAFKIKSRWVYFPAILIIAAVSISRLYFGAHWFTDVLGAWLLSAGILMLTALSYNRHAEKPLQARGILLTFFITLALSYSAVLYHSGDKLRYNNTLLEWPTFTISENAWWEQQGNYLPLYRVNRFGLSRQIFNVQWVGDLEQIKKILIQNGWQIPPKHDWISFLYRVSDIKSMEYLPLVSPLYLDKEPVLVLTKHLSGDKRLTAIRFWNSYTTFANSKRNLWVGTIETAPSTYSWIFKRKKNSDINANLYTVFIKPPKQNDIRQMTFTTTDNRKRTKEQTILLIKPRS